MDSSPINNGLTSSVSAPTILPPPAVNLSFAGCGFLAVYHAGVIAAIREYAPQLRSSQMSAASAGSIAAASLMCDVDVSKSISSFLKIVKEARSRALGALHPSFNLIDEVAKCLDATLPDNAHQICSGRLHISLTSEEHHQNVVVSDFESKAELIQAISCSCFIPYYCGRKFPSYRGKRYFDGGWSDNQPLYDENTVTISPFSGESDICPPDLDSANLFALSFAGTSIRFTSRNLYRLTVCLLPPSMEVCCRICRQGFEDALRFCIRNKLTTDARCLTILSNANIYLTEGRSLVKHRNSSSAMKATSANELPKLDRVYTFKDGTISKRVSAQLSSLFPEVLRRVIEDEDKDNTLLGYFFSFRLMRWIRTATIPFILPFEVLYLFCRSIKKWLEDKELDWWFARRLKAVVDFLLKEIELQRGIYSARLTCQLAITEMDITTFNRCKSSDGFDSYSSTEDFVLKIKPSIEAQQEYAMLKRHDSHVFARKLSRASSKSSTKNVTSNLKPVKPKTSGKVDDLPGLKEFANDCKPLLSYSYTNENNQVRVCEIFDVDRSKKQPFIDSCNESKSEKCKFHIGDFNGPDGNDANPKAAATNTAKQTATALKDGEEKQSNRSVGERLPSFTECL